MSLFLPTRSAALAAALLIAAPVLAQERSGREQSFHRTARPGERIAINTYSVFDRACNPRPAPAVVVRTAPQHGTVAAEPGAAEVRRVSEGATDCTGRVMPGTTVYYTPQPGFHGMDQFDYDVLTRTIRHDTATVEVR